MQDGNKSLADLLTRQLIPKVSKGSTCHILPTRFSKVQHFSMLVQTDQKLTRVQPAAGPFGASQAFTSR